METLTPHQIKIASSTENLNKVETLVEDICKEYRVNEDFYGNILVAVTEAVTNAIQHGNKSDNTKDVDISVNSDTQKVTFTISDQGNGFDFNNLPDPTDPENIEKPHGRGVFLMRHLADEVEFSENGQTVAIGFKVSMN